MFRTSPHSGTKHLWYVSCQTGGKMEAAYTCKHLDACVALSTRAHKIECPDWWFPSDNEESCRGVVRQPIWWCCISDQIMQRISEGFFTAPFTLPILTGPLEKWPFSLFLDEYSRQTLCQWGGADLFIREQHGCVHLGKVCMQSML